METNEMMSTLWHGQTDFDGNSRYRNRMRQAKALKAYAARLDDPPAECPHDQVRVRGDRLSRVLWQGQQSAVTSYGVECRDGTYCIERRRLWENEDVYGWVRHMAGKDWVNLDDFAEALRVARRFASTRRHPLATRMKAPRRPAAGIEKDWSEL
jgi:hypothetical protein